MAVYLIMNAKDCEDLSRELYKLSRPNPDPRDVTKYQFGWITHPVDGRVAIQIDLESEVPLENIHPRDLQKLNGLLNKITPGGSGKLAQNVADKPGGTRVKAKDILPDVVFLTEEQMQSDGWFITDEN